MLGANLNTFPQTDLTVTRATVASLVDGIATPGAATVLTLRGVVHPVSGRELDRLPEGLRTRTIKAVYTQEPLRTAVESLGAAPDRVQIGAETYQVARVEDWSQHGYYRSYCAREEAS